MADQAFRLRIRFSKADRLAYLSHLELARAMERLVRRSGLPYTVTQGFSTHMRFAPGPALPVGTWGLGELFDVWLSEFIDTQTALQALRRVVPEGMDILAVSYVDPKARGLAATHVLESYLVEIRLPDDLVQGFDQRVSELLQAGELTVERKGKSKTYDLKIAVEAAPKITSHGSDSGRHSVAMTLRSSPQGSIRPEVLLKALYQNSKELQIVEVARLSLAEEPG